MVNWVDIYVVSDKIRKTAETLKNFEQRNPDYWDEEKEKELIKEFAIGVDQLMSLIEEHPEISNELFDVMFDIQKG